MNKQLIESTLRLFKSVPVEDTKIYVGDNNYNREDVIKDTTPFGFVLAPIINANFLNLELVNLINTVKQVLTLSPEQLNSSFHKSWNKITTSDMEQLVVEQLAHYVTTYGREGGNMEAYLDDKEYQFEITGLKQKVANLPDFDMTKIWDQDYIYIPKEILNLPEIKDDFKLMIIRGLTKKELKEKLLDLLNSGIALKEQTIKDAVEIAHFVDLTVDEVVTLKNKETKCILYDKMDLIPENPTEFLRLLIYKATGTTLIIKNKALIANIKMNNIDIFRFLFKYEDRYSLKELATSFYRYKPLWLAFKSKNSSAINLIINRIRRLAVYLHEPMPEDYFNSFTGKLVNNVPINGFEFSVKVQDLSIFRKVRLAYALKYRTTDAKEILYRIRNSKSYAKEFNFNAKGKAQYALDIILNAIANDTAPNVAGKVIYIPDYMHYTLPATEKQFTGFFPTGTYVEIPSDMVFGINWFNLKRDTINEDYWYDDGRVDLDLSVMAMGTKMGWDGYYRNHEASILFSGDMTDADGPNGATESYYIKRQEEGNWIVFLNNYNCGNGIEIPFSLFVAQEFNEKLSMNYMVDPNNVKAIAAGSIVDKQKILGLLEIKPNVIRFYFGESNLGNSITSNSGKPYVEQARKYLVNNYINSINLKEVLEKAGAIIITDKAENGLQNLPIIDIDLSPEVLAKDTIINLLTKKE